MSEIKEQIIRLVREMPEDATINDIIAAVHFKRKLDAGLLDVSAIIHKLKRTLLFWASCAGALVLGALICEALLPCAPVLFSRTQTNINFYAFVTFIIFIWSIIRIAIWRKPGQRKRLRWQCFYFSLSFLLCFLLSTIDDSVSVHFYSLRNGNASHFVFRFRECYPDKQCLNRIFISGNNKLRWHKFSETHWSETLRIHNGNLYFRAQSCCEAPERISVFNPEGKLIKQCEFEFNKFGAKRHNLLGELINGDRFSALSPNLPDA